MMTEMEKMLAGELYRPADPEIAALHMWAVGLLYDYNHTRPENLAERDRILRELFGTVEGTIHIEQDFRCDYGKNIHVGDNFYANFGCVILDVCPVRIGKNCFLAPHVGIYTATHPIRAEERYLGLEYGSPITIGDNCWIGGNSVINPGVTLGNNVVVGSGSVVTKSFGDNVVIAGNPARVIREL
ncbi:MAG: sugar O-acetyltransferase [Ruminococcaceae bacterium]|nr:sugar O-acetyltransferase [Oscillospiraceae bacterium]